MSFTGRVAIITGASSGIGQAVARQLASQGCAVGLIARRQELLEQLAEEIRQLGATAALVPVDVSQRQQVLDAITQLSAQLGPVDLLFACAGMGGTMSLDPFDVEMAERIYRVNFFGVLYAIEAVLPTMLQRGTGHIAGVSSMAAYKGMPGYQVYTSSKAALNNFLEGLRVELRGKGIAVTTICPGFVHTAMTASHRFHMPFSLTPEKAAARIVRALARRRKVYNFPWRMMLLMRLLSWLPDWLVARWIPVPDEREREYSEPEA